MKPIPFDTEKRCWWESFCLLCALAEARFVRGFPNRKPRGGRDGDARRACERAQEEADAAVRRFHSRLLATAPGACRLAKISREYRLTPQEAVVVAGAALSECGYAPFRCDFQNLTIMACGFDLGRAVRMQAALFDPGSKLRRLVGFREAGPGDREAAIAPGQLGLTEAGHLDLLFGPPIGVEEAESLKARIREWSAAAGENDAWLEEDHSMEG